MAYSSRQLLDLLLAGRPPEQEAQLPWQPAADTFRCPDGWLVKFDLAGVRPEDFEVRLVGRRLTVEGIRRDWQIETGYHYYSMEISYNRFQRTIELPRALDQAQVTTEYRDGMLFVRLQTESEHHDE